MESKLELTLELELQRIISLQRTAIKNEDVNSSKIDSNYIVCRAFRKLPYILNISRENCIKKHKIIILKGRNAQKEINSTSKMKNYKYRLENSITDKDSKIIILNTE